MTLKEIRLECLRLALEHEPSRMVIATAATYESYVTNGHKVSTVKLVEDAREQQRAS